ILNETYKQLEHAERKLVKQNFSLEENKKQLQLSNQRYQIAVEGSHDGIWDWDIEKDIYEVSSNWYKEFGYTAETAPHSFVELIKLIHKDDREKTKSDVKKYFMRETSEYESVFRLRLSNDEYRNVLSKGLGIWENDKLVRMVGSHTDITEHVQMEETLYKMAYIDSLTNLPSKNGVESEVNRFISEEKKSRFAFVYFDIDNFKQINETTGHTIGDQLLMDVAKILQNQISAPNFVSRVGGDEFILLIESPFEEDKIIEIIKSIILPIEKVWIFGSQKFYLAMSAGVTFYPRDGINFSELFQKADTALFFAKDNGRGQIKVFNETMKESTQRLIDLSVEIRTAIKNNEFAIHYQPIYRLSTNKIIGVEALIRWTHPEKGMVSPAEFIPLAERSQIITAIDTYVFERVLQQKSKWNELGLNDFYISVNLSKRSLESPNLISEIIDYINQYNIDPRSIRIEVTETSVIQNFDLAIKTLTKLRALGIMVMMDDFGTGFSSLTYLERLPIDVVKIDREFIKRIVTEKKNALILESIITLIHRLGMRVVAEGVETFEQLEIVKKYHCDIVQGFYFSKALPPDELEYLIINQNNQ
ncbi:MAG: EAL domain-containing protein, partial [Acholeplasmataceae bacterium]